MRSSESATRRPRPSGRGHDAAPVPPGRRRTAARPRGTGPVRATRSERGAYTAELAVGLPSLVFLALWALWGVTVADTGLRCADATRAGARAAARGEPVDAVLAETRRAAPGDADVAVTRSAGTAVVRCVAVVGFGGVRTVTVRTRSVTATEDGPEVDSGSGGSSGQDDEPAGRSGGRSAP